MISSKQLPLMATAITACPPVSCARLVTNLPKEIMRFPSLPFDSSLPSFLAHGDVLAYLNGYAATFRLAPLLRLNRTVTNVEPILPRKGGAGAAYTDAAAAPPRSVAATDSYGEDEGMRCRWRVTHAATPGYEAADGASTIEVEEFDFVVVANGHYEAPVWPNASDIPGLLSTPGLAVIHSKDYDTPEAFAGKSVLIVGAK